MPLLPPNAKTPLGIYVHVPFCRSKCEYCNFYSLPHGSEEMMDRYQKAICTHIKETGPLAPGYQVDSVYFGGGTPSFLGADRLSAILATIRQSFNVSPRAEITFEANPDSVTPRLLRRLKSEGFNRVSLGIQSDDDEMLQRLGRPHSYEDAVEAVRLIRKAGFRNLSVDLMMWLPGQTLEGWLDTLSNVMELQPEHFSCYGLKVEEGTPMAGYIRPEHLPDEEVQTEMYLSTVEMLRRKGWRQYEISNFAKKGMVSRHNMKYWNGGQYLGFGPAASSDFAGKRFSTVEDIMEYIEGIREHGQVLVDVQEIPHRERAGEYLMTRLRTTMGISAEEYTQKYLLPFLPIETKLESYYETGHTTYINGRWRLTPAGFLISNQILSDLFLAQERAIEQTR